MNKIKLNEGLDFHDLEGMVLPVVSVDEYKSHMGKDSEIVTLAFIIRSEQAGTDLVDWFERGYDWVLDAQVSEGELSPGKFLVFVELARRTTVPKRIIELLDDLTTLTNIEVKDWTIKLDDEEYDADAEVLSQVITISPHEYREEEEEIEAESETELNEMRVAAGLDVKTVYHSDHPAIKAVRTLAGL